MKSAILLASAGVVVAQTITADINAISSAVESLNSQVSGFSEYSQASAIVDSSNMIVSLINKGASDAKAEGSISPGNAANLLMPFEALQTAVEGVVNNLVSRKAIATSLTLGNVVEAQLESQLAAASGLAASVEAQLPAGDFQSLGSSLAGVILSALSSGSSAFSGLSGPSTLGAAPASTSASTTSAASSSGSSSAASSSSSASTAAGSGPTTASSTVISTPSSTTSVASSSSASSGMSPSSSVTPSTGGANKAAMGVFGVIAATFFGMLAL